MERHALSGISVVIPAAGAGRRMGSAVAKQYLTIAGRTILEITLGRILGLGPDRLVLVVSEGDVLYRNVPGTEHCEIVIGGEARSDSVRAGLRALPPEDDRLVMIHDAVRPCVRTSDIIQLVKIAGTGEAGGLLAVPVVDTLKSGVGGRVDRTVDRTGLWQAQTPQLFRYGQLMAALASACRAGETVTDEAALLELAGFRPCLVQGHRDNIKITDPADLAMAELVLAAQGVCP
jgi:2-C-methyl-D-erythritol 4-phosphate cytidylyltransferase